MLKATEMTWEVCLTNILAFAAEHLPIISKASHPRISPGSTRTAPVRARHTDIETAVPTPRLWISSP